MYVLASSFTKKAITSKPKTTGTDANKKTCWYSWIVGLWVLAAKIDSRRNDATGPNTAPR